MREPPQSPSPLDGVALLRRASDDRAQLGHAWDERNLDVLRGRRHTARRHSGHGGGRGYLTPLETRVVGETIGKASALKMCYAAYSKGTTALLCAALAAAERLGVRHELQQHWARDGREGAEKAAQRLRRVPDKAWRFVGEMEEIAATFRAAGVPDGFHTAAADVYRRLAGLKDAPATPALEDILTALLQTEDTPRA